MKRKFLGEIDQLVGFSLYSFENKKFKRFHATDIFKGVLISSNTDDTLEDLIYPYSLDELKNALEASGKENVLNSQVIEILPCEDIRFSDEYGGVIGSMSHREVPFYSVTVRNVNEPERVEFFCKCDKRYKRRDVSKVWFPAILKEWNLNPNKKYYSDTTCPHISAFDFHLRKVAGVNSLGIKDNLEYIKPFLLSWIDVIKRFPDLPDYAIDFAYLYESSMFDDAKEYVNKVRRSHGLDDLRIYSNPYLKRYIINKMEISKEKMKKVVKTIGY